MAEQPRPKSPPGTGHVNWYAKTRQQAKLLALESEIGFLQEELNSLENAQPTSRCLKELDEFVATRPDPLISVNQKPCESDCSWRRIGCCCSSNDAQHPRIERRRKGRSCCSSRGKCCSSGDCSWLRPNCCSFKLCCSSHCLSKVKLCPSCVPNCCGCCCI